MYASEPATVPARGQALISTGLSFEIPVHSYGRVAPRSGLAVKNFIDVGAGVIDSDYRGEVKVLLRNLDQHNDFAVKSGDRIAQLVITKITPTQLVQVDDLDDTNRGAAGFGSTGISDTPKTSAKKRDLNQQAATDVTPKTDKSTPAHNFAGVSVLGKPEEVLLKTGDQVKGGTPTTVGEVMKDAGKLIMVYISMHDCPGCLEFTPMLVELYREMNETEKTFEVVFFSGDKKEEVFQDYFADMPWPALPFKDSRLKKACK